MAQRGRLRTVEGEGYLFWCPGCERFHGYYGTDRRWRFDGNFDAPTVSPSFVVEYRTPDGRLYRRCHCVVARGSIAFLADSTHALAGTTVPLPVPPGPPDA
jgi:hypothetical protein